jgi:hypothetical protein
VTRIVLFASTYLVFHALACSNLPDRPEPPDMAPLVDAYAHPTAELDQAIADELRSPSRPTSSGRGDTSGRGQAGLGTSRATALGKLSAACARRTRARQAARTATTRTTRNTPLIQSPTLSGRKESTTPTR